MACEHANYQHPRLAAFFEKMCIRCLIDWTGMITWIRHFSQVCEIETFLATACEIKHFFDSL